MEIPNGTLVRLTRQTYDTASFFPREPDDGWLWIVEGHSSGKDAQGYSYHLYRCRSLSTGQESVWYDYEFEVQDAEA